MDHTGPITLSTSRGKPEVFSKLAKIPGVQMIYVSALACTRHRGFEFVEMQRQGRLSFLLFSEVDMVTGDYITKTKDAAAEIAAERSPTGIILLTGCQSALLSTDYKLLTEEIEEETGVPVRVHDGCRLCGFDEDKAGSGSVNQLLYDFIRPAGKSGELSVNILGSPLDESGELFSLLKDAGVKQINSLSACRTFADYQEMGRAHLNIITSAQDMAIGPHLQEKLGIPWVCLGGIYDGAELERSYRTLGEVLGTDIDVSHWKKQLEEKIQAVKEAVGGRPIAVEGDAQLAKWLSQEGFSVESLSLNPHQGLSKELRDWFAEHAPELKLQGAGKGGPGGGHGGPGGGHGRPGGRPGGRGGKGPGGPGGHGRPGGRGPQQAQIGYAGSMSALEALERRAGGDER